MMHTSAILMNDWVTADGAACVGSGQCPNQIVSRLISRNPKPEPAVCVLTDPGRLGPMKLQRWWGACSWWRTSDNSMGGKSFHLAWLKVNFETRKSWLVMRAKGWTVFVNQVSKHTHSIDLWVFIYFIYLSSYLGLFFFSWDERRTKWLISLVAFLSNRPQWLIDSLSQEACWHWRTGNYNVGMSETTCNIID